MRAGRRRHYLQFRRVATTVDAAGGVTETLVDGPGMWADVQTASSAEAQAGAGVITSTTLEATVDYDDGADVRPADRAEHDGETFRVASRPTDPDGRRVVRTIRLVGASS